MPTVPKFLARPLLPCITLRVLVLGIVTFYERYDPQYLDL